MILLFENIKGINRQNSVLINCLNVLKMNWSFVHMFVKMSYVRQEGVEMYDLYFSNYIVSLTPSVEWLGNNNMAITYHTSFWAQRVFCLVLILCPKWQPKRGARWLLQSWVRKGEIEDKERQLSACFFYILQKWGLYFHLTLAALPQFLTTSACTLCRCHFG